MKQRLYWLDVMKGSVIILVVLGHSLNSLKLMSHPINIWIHQFHMPFFFILSGFLALHTLKSPFLTNLKKKIITLIIPFITCGSIYSLATSHFHDYIFGISHNGYWFLISLFTCWVIFLSLSATLERVYIWKFLVTKIIVLILPFFLGNLLMSLLPEYISNMFSFPLTFAHYRFFIFGYFIGYFYNNLKYKNTVKKIISGKRLFAISFLAFIGVTLGILTNENFLSYLPPTIWSILLCCSLFIILYYSSNFISMKILELLNYIGRNSLAIYVLHVFFVYLFPISEVSLISSGLQFLIGIGITTISIISSLGLAAPIKSNTILLFLLLGQKTKNITNK